MAIDRGAPQWPYQQLAARLRDQIASAQITGQLPSIKWLAQEYGLSEKTVVKALRLLVAEGVIATYPNRGSFVVAE